MSSNPHNDLSKHPLVTTTKEINSELYWTGLDKIENDSTTGATEVDEQQQWVSRCPIRIHCTQ